MRLFPLLVSWLATGVALMVAAGILPGVHIDDFWGALLVAAIVAALNAVIPPVLAALRLPLTLVLGFLLVLIADAVILLHRRRRDRRRAQGRQLRLGAARRARRRRRERRARRASSARTTRPSIRIAQRIARRQGIIASTDVPGIVFLEIDGLALPVLRRAMRDGNAPNMARWLAEDTHRLTEWETDLSSQTGASQAGILLGSNEDISAFRWVEKETATLMTCSAPPDCAEIERRHATGIGLLVDGGASRGNLLSGEADEVILTVSRMEAEKKSNPGYRAFLANGDNVTRTLVLFAWEVILEWTAALRAIRRDVRPRGHRGGIYPLMRGALCVFVRDLIVSGVLTDMMRGRPAVYATFSSYDEVAHHSGLERADTLEALRKLDDHFGADRASSPLRPAAVRDRRPLRPRADAGRDLQAAQRVRARRARRALALARRRRRDRRRRRAELDGRQRRQRGDGEEGEAAQERRLRPGRRRARLRQPRPRLPDGGAPPADARGDRRAAPGADPRPARASARRLAARPLVRARRGRARRPRRPLPRRRPRRGRRPARAVLAHAPQHLLRTDGFAHVADIMVGSFYDPELDEGCAFEELISFHGGIGGPQTRPFILHPAQLEVPPGPILGAASVHGILAGWRQQLQAGRTAAVQAQAERTAAAGVAEQPVGHPG